MAETRDRGEDQLDDLTGRVSPVGLVNFLATETHRLGRWVSPRYGSLGRFIPPKLSYLGFCPRGVLKLDSAMAAMKNLVQTTKKTWTLGQPQAKKSIRPYVLCGFHFLTIAHPLVIHTTWP